MSKPIILSGVKPTGRPHIGNYFGAMKQFVDFQDEYKSFIFIPDYHALNFVQNKDEMNQNILDLAIDYLSIGLDPEKVTLFKQSDVPQHTELTWIFDTIMTVPYLMRAHAYKDKTAKGIEASVGLFNYPMLMAADILMYDPDVVPVGKDQRQHVEFARDTAEKFNRIYGETFKVPKEIVLKDVAVVPGIDGQKMSKSYGNTIELFAERENIEKAVMNVVTDSEGEFPENICNIHKLFKSEEELKPIYEENKGKYKNLKEILIDDIDSFISPLREKRKEFESNKDLVLRVLKEGGEKAQEVAEKKMREVRKAIGVDIYG